MHKPKGINITATRVQCYSAVCILETKRTNDAAQYNKYSKPNLYRFMVLFSHKILPYLKCIWNYPHVKVKKGILNYISTDWGPADSIYMADNSDKKTPTETGTHPGFTVSFQIRCQDMFFSGILSLVGQKTEKVCLCAVGSSLFKNLPWVRSDMKTEKRAIWNFPLNKNANQGSYTPTRFILQIKQLLGRLI